MIFSPLVWLCPFQSSSWSSTFADTEDIASSSPPFVGGFHFIFVVVVVNSFGSNNNSSSGALHHPFSNESQARTFHTQV